MRVGLWAGGRGEGGAVQVAGGKQAWTDERRVLRRLLPAGSQRGAGRQAQPCSTELGAGAGMDAAPVRGPASKSRLPHHRLPPTFSVMTTGRPIALRRRPGRRTYTMPKVAGLRWM